VDEYRERLEQILKMDFTALDVARHRELAAKAQLGTLNEAETNELDAMLVMNDLLATMHAKARAALDKM